MPVTKNTTSAKTAEKESAEILALKQQNESMQEQMLQMKQMMEMLMKQQSAPQVSVLNSNEPKEISMNSYIKVMSLYKGGMTLFVSPNGKSYRFSEFGEIVPILYSDLTGILSTHPTFARKGYFFILDTEVVKQSALEKYYTRILDKDSIENILEKDDSEIKEIFNLVTPYMQNLILEIISEKMVNGEYVNRDKLHLIKEITGKDIEQTAKALKEGLTSMESM